MNNDYTKMTLGEFLASGDSTIGRNAMSILKQLQRKNAKIEEKEFFPITSVSRADLTGIGFDTSKVDDATMEHLASKMADAYCDNGFWIDLPILAEAVGIPKRKK